MKSIALSVRTTLIGGVLVVLPTYVTLLLLAKVAKGLLTAIMPITSMIPESTHYRVLIAVLLLVALCFVAGLVLRSGPGIRATGHLEKSVLNKLPGYALLHGLTARITGSVNDATFKPALAEIEEAFVPALIIEELEDGSYTVFVPSVPTPMAGALYILTRERVHPVDLPITVALGVFSRWGAGAGAFLKAVRPAIPHPSARRASSEGGL
jgi:uncharacterized membrane protein